MSITMADYRQAASLINSASRILITTHIRPDGDAIGCLAALKSAIESQTQAGRPPQQVQLLLLSPIGDIYKFLVPPDAWVLGEHITAERIQAGCLDEFGLIIICDTAAQRQLDCLYDYLQKRSKPVIVIDHHLSGDGIGHVRLIDSDASAAGEIVFELCDRADWPIGPVVAEALFTAIATDTGWFHFENTSPRALQIAGELIEMGVRPDQLYQKLFMQDPPERLQLLAAAIQTLELHHDSRCAVMHITKTMLEQTGAQRWQLENMVNEPMRIRSVIVSLLFVEQDDGSTRCSLRSKAVIDVNALAGQFGGGGHARASGAILKCPLDQAKRQLIDATGTVLNPG